MEKLKVNHNINISNYQNKVKKEFIDKTNEIYKIKNNEIDNLKIELNKLI